MKLNGYIDHTILKPTTLISDVEKLCKEAIQHQFAAVCVPPPFIKTAKQFLQGSTVKTATVIGFPFGYSAIEAKIAEVVLAMIDGVDELDIVINLIALKNNDWQYLANEISHIIPVIKQQQKTVKIIIESGILTNDEIIKCCQLYAPAGIDFMKTSTGYAEQGATVEAVELMRKHLSPSIQIKASGGIKTYAFAKALIEGGATRLGCSAGVAIVQQQDATAAGY
ncbi:deoxyribose-phosphate aldolase [Limnovirga soli]|uniref:Deoxyribose-phosphate aldolase n=1 Tax=Limnovirga soli TaxID=2656915 RepID=A0A8J8FH98_9BACT|nr:deoxyribose-phosphate aldolase [Limnovirga soli]NNV57068.1 deoxyribose-phosphate aldolase [Limnovirga soli]